MSRIYRALILAVHFLPGVVLFLSGCGPSALVRSSDALPRTWSGRSLYVTPRAYIYAGSSRAAGEADRVVRSAGEQLEKNGGRMAGKPLLVVTDTGDPPPIKSLDRILRLAVKKNAGNPKADADLQARMAVARQVLASQPAGTQTTVLAMFDVMPLTMEREEILALMDVPGKLPREVSWGAVISTRPVIERALRRMFQANLKQQNAGVVARATMAPLLLIAESAAVNGMAVGRETALYERLCRDQAHWSPEEQKARAEAFEEKKAREAMGILGLFAEPGKPGRVKPR
jgi:hypothetical protein